MTTYPVTTSRTSTLSGMPVHLAQPAEEVWRKLLSYLGANLGPEPAEQRITWTFECSKDTGYDFSKNTRRE